MIESLLVHQAIESPIEARITPPDSPGWAGYGGGGEWVDSSGYYGPPGGYGSFNWPAFFASGATGWADGAPLSDWQCFQYSVVYACIRYISQTVASLGWHQYERQKDFRTRIPIYDDVSWLLDLQSSPEMSAFDFRQVMVKDALACGNGYAEIERTKSGKPWALWRIDPYRVYLQRDDNGQLVYAINDFRGGDYQYLDPADVFHLKNLGPDGLIGWSVLRIAGMVIELGLNQMKYGTTFFRRGPFPGGILKIPGVMKKPERDDMRDSFNRAHGGWRNAGRVIVLTGGAEFDPLKIPMADAKLMESSKFTGEDVARFFGVPLSKLGMLDSATHSTTEQLAIEAVQDCLLPWCRRLETEADIKMYGRTNRGRKFTKLNLGTLLRGDMKTQTESVTKRVVSGVNTPNEARDYFDLNPVDGGDTPLIQGAMVRLEDVVSGKTQRVPPDPSPAPSTIPEDVRLTFTELLEGVYSRQLRIESDRARGAQNKGKLLPWARSYYNEEAQQHLASIIRPVVAALYASIRVSVKTMEEMVARLASEHIQHGLNAIMHRGIEATQTWNGDTPREQTRAAVQAKEHIGVLWESVR